MKEIEMPMEMTTHLLKNTVDTCIDLDEPEALLSTLRDAAKRQKGKRWQALAHVLAGAEAELDHILNAKPAGPDFTNEATANFHKPIDELVGRKPEPVNTDEDAKSA